MKTKRKGNRNEHRSTQLLEAEGYCCVRSAASLGCFDVIGIGSSDGILAQVKSNDWPSGCEMESIRGFVCPPGTKKLIHRCRVRAQQPDVRTV